MGVSLVLGLAAVALLLLLGIPAFILGLRGRVVDALPYCRRCRFCLDGLPTGPGAACPECGSSLDAPTALRIGRRRPRPAFIAVGSLCLLLVLGVGGTAGVFWARGFNWNTIKPVWLLEMDAGSANPATAAGAWTEFSRRIGAGTLGATDATRLVGRALILQQDDAHPWTVEIGTFVEDAHGAGHVTDPQWLAFHREGVLIAPRIRPVVSAGGQLPVQVTVFKGRLGTRSSLLLGLNQLDIRATDGSVIASEPMGNMVHLSGSGRSSSSRTVRATLAPGAYDVVFSCGLALHTNFNQPAIYEWTLEFPLAFEVVEGPTVSVLSPEPAMDAQVHAAISIGRFGVHSVRDGQAEGSIEVRAANLPAACSFDVLALIDGREVPALAVTFPASGGEHRVSTSFSIRGLHTNAVTLIFRTNPAHAERTVDLIDLWPGQVTLPDLPVSWPANLERPGPTQPNPLGR